MPSKASSLPKSWLEPKIPGHSSACQHISVNPTGEICLVLLGCRSAPLSLPYIMLTHIPVVVILFTTSTAYHYAQGNLQKNTPLTKRTLLSFEVNCSKARKLFCRLHSHPSSHGWIMIGPLIVSSQAIFSFLRQKSFRAGLLGGNSKDQQAYLANSYLIFFPHCTMCILRSCLFASDSDSKWLIFLWQPYPHVACSLMAMGVPGDKSLMSASGSEYLKGEMALTLHLLNPVLQVKAVIPDSQREAETQKMGQQWVM